MAQKKIETRVKERYGTGLYEFIDKKVRIENLHDYEIAGLLDVSPSLVGQIRRDYGIEKANGFLRRFERTYGRGAVAKFKEIIQDPGGTLTDVGRHFGFSREYARHVYQKIFGHVYSEAYRKKLEYKRKQKIAEKVRTSKRVQNLISVGRKMKSQGIPFEIASNGQSYILKTNGYKLGVRMSSKPITVGKKEYYRINNEAWSNEDFDFFICLCRSKKDRTHFIIPSDEMPQTFVSLLPEATKNNSKYAQYKEAWHLLRH